MSKRKLVYVIDGDICGALEFEINSLEDNVLVDNLILNPYPIEIPLDKEVLVGWVYNKNE
jgi:hypothetical protein